MKSQKNTMIDAIRYVLIAAVFVSIGLIPPDASAQTTKPTVVAVLDIARIFEQYQMTSDLEGLFNAKQQSITAERDRRVQDIEARRKELEAFEANTPDYQQRFEALVRAEVELQVWKTTQERLLKEEHLRLILQIYRDVREIVKSIAESRSIDLVLTYDQLSVDAPDSVSLRQQILLQKVIYSSSEIDITDNVLTTLNDRYQQRGGPESLKVGAKGATPKDDEAPKKTASGEPSTNDSET